MAPSMKPLQVGLLGIGTVGHGTWTCCAATRRRSRAAPAGRSASPGSPSARSTARASCTRGATGVNLTDDAAVVLAHPDIDIVVELIGGIEPARTLILQAIANGKHVVTANKALLARHGNEIFAAAHAKGVMVAFEARGGGRHPDHQGAARGPDRQPHRVDRRHHQRHVATSSCRRCARRGASFADGAGRGAGARLRRGRSDVRHRGHRRRAQAHDHVGDRLRRADAVRQGLHRGHLEADARGHPLRRGAGLPDQAARHHAAHARRHRAARASDADPDEAPDRQRRGRDERGAGQGRRGRRRRCTTAPAPAPSRPRAR